MQPILFTYELTGICTIYNIISTQRLNVLSFCCFIGSNFFWSFPSAAYIRKRNRVDELNEAITATEVNISNQENAIKKLKVDRCDPAREDKVEM